jgi:radical SAM protein with 4Fe4S-binding SPASM domain
MRNLKLNNLASKSIKKESKLWRFLEVLYSFRFFFIYHRNVKPKAATTREIYIEFVSYCNLRCKLCSLDHTKPHLRIDVKTIVRLFDELFYDRRFRKVNVIHLHNAGELLMHPHFKELIEQLKIQKDRFTKSGYKFPDVSMLTNGLLLTKDIAHFIIESGTINRILFSMDGGTPEKFEELRSRANWDTFYENITSFINLNKRKIYTSVICLVEQEKKLTTRWMHPTFKEILSRIDSYELRHPHNWRGEVKEGTKLIQKRFKMGCNMLIDQLVFLPNGDVTVCCNDLNSKGVIGNIQTDSLFSIYSSYKRTYVIEMLQKRRKHMTELCSDCATF